MDYSRYQDLKIHMLEPGIAEIVMGEEGGKEAVVQRMARPPAGVTREQGRPAKR